MSSCLSVILSESLNILSKRKFFWIRSIQNIIVFSFLVWIKKFDLKWPFFIAKVFLERIFFEKYQILIICPFVAIWYFGDPERIPSENLISRKIELERWRRNLWNRNLCQTIVLKALTSSDISELNTVWTCEDKRLSADK